MTVLARLEELRLRTERWWGPVAFGVGYQLLNSVANFLFGLWVLRSLSVDDYGRYTIGLAAVLFIGGVSNSLFLVQMVVRTPEKPADERPAYAARMCILVCALSIGVLVLGGLGSFVGVWARLAGVEVGRLVGPTLFASAGFVLREFAIRHAFNFKSGRWSFEASVLLSVAYLAGARLIGGDTLNLGSVLMAYGASQWVSGLYGLARGSLPLTSPVLKHLTRDLREALAGGRWVFVSNLLQFLRGHAHTLIVAAVIGTVDVGRLNAARLVLTPAIVLIPVAARLLMPRLSGIRETGAGYQRTRSMGYTAMGGLVLIAAAYGASVVVAYPVVVSHVLGPQYEGIRGLIVLWAVVVCLTSLRDSLGMMTLVFKQFRRLALVDVVSVSVTLSLTYWFAVTRGVGWVLVGLIAGLVVASGLLFRVVEQTARHSGPGGSG